MPRFASLIENSTVDFVVIDSKTSPEVPEESEPGYDAILIVGFGGPQRREDVLPFLENVTRGRGVPRDRLLAVAEHYDHFGGASPYNAQVRATDRRAQTRVNARGDRAADLLGQSQLASDAGRDAGRDVGSRAQACAGDRSGGL